MPDVINETMRDLTTNIISVLSVWLNLSSTFRENIMEFERFCSAEGRSNVMTNFIAESRLTLMQRKVNK